MPNKLDQDPRDDPEEDKAVAAGVLGEVARRGHRGEVVCRARLLSLWRERLK